VYLTPAAASSKRTEITTRYLTKPQKPEKERRKKEERRTKKGERRKEKDQSTRFRKRGSRGKPALLYLLEF